MIKLATVFSGIGAIEHALDRMGLEHKIVFACDNGDVDILSKKIDDNINEIEDEINSLKKIVENNAKKEDEFSKQLKQCENKLKKAKKIISEIQFEKLDINLKEILKKSMNSETKKTKIKEYECLKSTMECLDLNDENLIFEQIKITLKILNDFSKDNDLKKLDKSKIKSSDNLEWEVVLENIKFISSISEKNDFKKIQKDVKEVCEYLGMLHERINTQKIHKELENMKNYSDKKKYVDNLYKGKESQNKVKQSYMANYKINEEDFHWNVSFLDGKQYKNKVDLFVGGSPCQSFSLVGKQRGLEDTRGTLFYEYARLVSEIKPKVFIYENVKAVLSNDDGRTWETMQKVFTDLDYTWKQTVLNAKDFGIPQNRERIFVVGFRNDIVKDMKKGFKFPEPVGLDKKMQDFLLDNVSGKYYLPKKGVAFVTDEENLNKRYTQIDGEVSLCQKKNQQFNWHGDFVFVEENKDMEKTMQDLEKYFLSEKVKKYVLATGTKGFYSRPEIDLEIARPLLTTMHKMHRAGVDNYVTTEGRIRKLTPRECLRLMGFCDSFKIEVSDTSMYQQAGNSIVVDVLIAIMTEILKCYDFDQEET